MIPDNANFFMSQSAIEHFENDLLYFQQIKKHIDNSGKNTIQVHLFPSAACLRLYLFHGIRQYTPRTESSIVDLFDSPNSYSTLFRLGGPNCNNLHFKYITNPLILKKEDYRDTKTEEYEEKLKLAIEKDMYQENHKPSFYALIVHSNYQRPIFKEMHTLSMVKEHENI